MLATLLLISCVSYFNLFCMLWERVQRTNGQRQQGAIFKSLRVITCESELASPNNNLPQISIIILIITPT
ncbi:hypothetical protein PJIAN_267 [Paludibacter jiangxiensis]|uniref:Uncharacterized protein n=1 Tax=Paludibacter jiangxiensis TaxID=681398 RepID=A0A170ZC01_9BACT|nr:hypothetical protein PJIAN_267 [Paludibacter jiangxiensis]